MQRFKITKGATSVIIPVSVFDASSTVGAKLAGLAYNSSGLTGYYNRMGAAGSATAISLATATKGTWATGGFVAIDGTNMPGDYELHIPDAALATGVNIVTIQLKGATNMVPVNIVIELIAINQQDAANMGLTDVAAIKAKTDNLPAAPAATGDIPSANITAIKAKTDNLPADPASNTQVNTRLAASSYTAPANSDITAIKAKTDNLPAAPASNTVEGSLTVAHAMQAILAACAGKSDGGGSATIHFRDQADSKNRITATVDSNGDRTAITLSYD